tara:strand:- start:319 stop:465 length:147 start_codon:yes stop_codon:yes gene_type:complete
LFYAGRVEGFLLPRGLPHHRKQGREAGKEGRRGSAGREGTEGRLNYSL